jgi:hypothetical protein
MPRADKAPHHPLHDKGADDIPAPHMQGIRAHALIFADAYPEANATPVGFLSSIRGKEKNTSKRPSAPDPTGAGSPGANAQAAEEGNVCCSEDNQRGSRLIPNRRYKLPQLRQRKWWGFFWNN